MATKTDAHRHREEPAGRRGDPESRTGLLRYALQGFARNDAQVFVSSCMDKGLTLIEVMIAVAILAMISLLSFQSMTEMLDSQAIADGRDERVHEVRLTFDKLFFDLSQAFLAGAEHQGAKKSSQPAFVGSGNALHFASFARRSYFQGIYGSDQCEIGYTIEVSEEGTNRLLRRESQWIDDKPEEGGRAYPLLDHVQEITFQYYDPPQKEWLSEWNSTSVSKHGKLPRAVKMTLVLQVEEEGEVSEESWTSEFPIALHQAELSF